MPGAPRESRESLSRLAVTLCTALALALVCAAVVAALAQARDAAKIRKSEEAHRPVEVQSQHYVSSNECRSCHPREHASWSASFHRSMTRLAGPDTVRGQFDGVKLGQTPEYTLGRTGLGFYADIAPFAGAQRERRPIALVTGSHHMQIYWYETGHDRSLGQLPYAYLLNDRRWVPRNAIFLEPPAPLTPAAEGRWNASCIACHTTLGQPRIDASGKFDTEAAEFGIACEACHGPGEEHVARNRSPLARYRRHLGGELAQAIVQPKKLSHTRSAYVCGQCHATWLYDSPASMREWNEHGTAFRPGGAPPASVWLLQPSRASADPRIAEVVARERSYVEGQFWSDGVMRVSGREFNGMVESPCYLRGEMSCLSCHAMHQAEGDRRAADVWRDDQLASGMAGDRACLQCHDAYARAPEKHTHHLPASEGSRCYNCHMPYTSYGLLKALRNHRIDVPGVAETMNAGRPNACNLCHLDQSLAWTAEQLKRLYGLDYPAIEGDAASVPLALWLGLRGDAGQRALIAWALGWSPSQSASKPAFAPALLGELMDDPYDAVRYIAERSLRTSGFDLRNLRYDFTQRPAERAKVAESIAERTAPELRAEERAQMRTLFARLLRERDEKPMRLLE